MQSATSGLSPDGREATRTDRNLVSLATPVLDLVMQIKAGVRTPEGDFRGLVDGALRQMEQRATRFGYNQGQIQAVKFGLAAFVDETILAGGFAIRDEWERNPLQLDYFQEAFAGVKFFDRLDEMLKNIEPEADVVEVYYLCLLLGFKGKYHIFLEDQLPAVINNVAEHLRRVGRLRTSVLSPHWQMNDQPAPPPAAPELPRWIKTGVAAALGFVGLIYLALSFFLTSSLNEVRQALLK